MTGAELLAEKQKELDEALKQLSGFRAEAKEASLIVEKATKSYEELRPRIKELQKEVKIAKAKEKAEAEKKGD